MTDIEPFRPEPERERFELPWQPESHHQATNVRRVRPAREFWAVVDDQPRQVSVSERFARQAPTFVVLPSPRSRFGVMGFMLAAGSALIAGLVYTSLALLLLSGVVMGLVAGVIAITNHWDRQARWVAEQFPTQNREESRKHG